MIFVNGVGGGEYGCNPNICEWYHGPMTPDNDKWIGMEFHLDSIALYSRTEVSFQNGFINYKMVELFTKEVQTEYNQTVTIY